MGSAHLLQPVNIMALFNLYFKNLNSKKEKKLFEIIEKLTNGVNYPLINMGSFNNPLKYCYF